MMRLTVLALLIVVGPDMDLRLGHLALPID